LVVGAAKKSPIACKRLGFGQVQPAVLAVDHDLGLARWLGGVGRIFVAFFSPPPPCAEQKQQQDQPIPHALRPKITSRTKREPT
jgi:hypothetical protein